MYRLSIYLSTYHISNNIIYIAIIYLYIYYLSVYNLFYISLSPPPPESNTGFCHSWVTNCFELILEMWTSYSISLALPLNILNLAQKLNLLSFFFFLKELRSGHKLESVSLTGEAPSFGLRSLPPQRPDRKVTLASPLLLSHLKA